MGLSSGRFGRGLIWIAAWAFTAVGLLPACGDEAGPEMIPAFDQGAPTETADGGPTADAQQAAGPQGQIQIGLIPEKPIYSPGDTFRVRVSGIRPDGAALNPNRAVVTASPPEVARMATPDAVEILGVGSGRVRACVDQTCGYRAFVSSTRPEIVIETPARGAMVGGDGQDVISVTGRVFNAGDGVRAMVNGEIVTLDAEGAFQTAVPAKFGINLLEATVTDNLHVVPKGNKLAVLWAPSFTDSRGGTASFPKTAKVRLDQRLLDSDVSLAPDVGPEFSVNDFAQLVQLLFLHGDIRDLLETAVVIDDQTVRFSVTDVNFTVPQVDLEIVGNGIELLARMEGLGVSTAGSINIEGRPISLDGSITADIAIFAMIELSHGEIVEASIPQYDVSVTNLQGAYADAAVNTLLQGLDNRLSLGARRIIEELAGTLIREDVPALIAVGFAELTAELSALPIYVQPALPGLPEVQLSLGLESKNIEHRPGAATILTLGAVVENPNPGANPHPTLGIATHRPREWPIVPQEGVGTTVSLDVFNAICHEIWRAGLFQGSPELPAVVGATIGEVSFDGLLPPVVMARPGGGVNGLQIDLSEFILTVTPLGADGADRYALYITIPVAATASQGYVGLSAPDDVEVKAVLLDTTSGQPFDADQLSTLIASTVWPLLRDSLNQGLRYGIQDLQVDPVALSAITPTVTRLTFSPDLSGAVRYEEDHVTFEGGMTAEGSLAAPPSD